jgi:hypothetical protein
MHIGMFENGAPLALSERIIQKDPVEFNSLNFNLVAKLRPPFHI